jgi:hypothetical protein
LEDRDLANPSDLVKAFDAALGQVRRSIERGMTAANGSSAEPQLRQLEGELHAQCARATEGGVLDRAWFQQTVRWMDEWVPDTEIMLIAALGRIARAAAPPV